MGTWAVLVILIVVGIALAVSVWVISGGRAHKKVQEQRERATAAEARMDEMRNALETARRDFDTLRDKLREAENARVAAETTASTIEKNLAEQKALLEDARTILTDTFKSLAAEVLSGTNKEFLSLAEEKFKALREGAAGDLESRKQAIETLIKPLADTLSAYQTEIKTLEESHQQALGAVTETIRSQATATATLQSETSKLVNALKSPQVRGRWGEIALKKTAELAGMSEHCDFVEQQHVVGDEGSLRPDMVVRLPASREVVVDSKVPLGGFLEALEAKTDDERDKALVKHAAQVNQHVQKLASKKYWDQFPTAPEFAVLFIPNDSFLAAAAEKDPNLVESALTRNVVIATPSTFIALLKAISFGWRQEQLTENAKEISDLGKTLADRIAMLVTHVVKIGTAMENAVGSYNDAVSSLESRVMPAARRFKTLGAGGKKEIEQLTPIDKAVRKIPALPEDGIN